MISKNFKKHIGWDEYARFLVPFNLIDDAFLLSLFIGSDKISTNLMEFNITINNENAAGNFNVTIKGQNKTTGLITTEKSKIESITNSSLTAHNSLINVTIADLDYLHVYIDFNNNIVEADETDNYVLMPFIKIKEKAYLDINTGNPKADEAIKGYLKLFVQDVSEINASIIISVGGNSSKVNSLNSYTQTNFRWYYDKAKKVPILNDKHVGFTPYSALVGRFFYNGKSHVFAYGRGIEGDVAAVKHIVSAHQLYLDFYGHEGAAFAKFVTVLDEKDRTGLAVMDLMHNRENQPYYNAKSGTNGNKFKEIIEKILLDNNFEIAIKTVQTTEGTSYGKNTTLRLKNLNSDFSTTFKEVVLNNTKPIVMSSGIFSDLFTFEDGLGGDLVKEGYDVWTIEMNGKENTKCQT